MKQTITYDTNSKQYHFYTIPDFTKPEQCTEEQRMDFIVQYNHNMGYKIEETENSLEAWGYTEEEKQQQRKFY